jgi:ATP-dependent RNA helicase HelY
MKPRPGYGRHHGGQRKRPHRQVMFRPGADRRLKRIFSAIGTPDPSPFSPDRFQLEALEYLNQGDVLVTVPTGAGKTWIALEAIFRMQATGQRAWYACPLKALSNAKYHEFREAFGHDQVGILTGDVKENPDAPITVGTTEILRNQLYDAMHRGESLAADFVVLDEAHYLGDTDRGVVWEEIMIYLPARIPLLMLSATIGNAGQISRWLSGIRKKPCFVVRDEKRPVPLAPLFLHPSGVLHPLKPVENSKSDKNLDKKVRHYLAQRHPPVLSRGSQLPPFADIIRLLRKYRLLPCIFFMKSRSDCDRALERCARGGLAEGPPREDLRQRVHELTAKNPRMARHRQRRHLEQMAVGAHHSGQLPAWKQVIEALLTDGALDAVFATSTVAAGVNFPARTVAFLNSDRFNGREFVPLSPTEFHQMTGRAGRRGMDNIGFALVVPGRYMDLRLMAKLVDVGPLPVNSQIRIDFSMALNLMLSHTPEQVESLLKNSFIAFQMTEGRAKKQKGGTFGSRTRLLKEFFRHLNFLKYIEYVGNEGRLTETGLWASQLRIDQPLMIAEGLRNGLFPRKNPPLLAALFAPFVYDKGKDINAPEDRIPEILRDRYYKLVNGLQSFADEMVAAGFEVRPLTLAPAALIYDWASGTEWDDLRKRYGIADGDLVMLILRTADNLRHIRGLAHVFPDVAQSARTALGQLLREPVLMD